MASHVEPYPREQLPGTPVLSAAALLGRRGPHIAAVTDNPQVRHVTSGRIALALALREMGIGPGDRVLVPAYHSISMIPPIVAAGAEPVFYRIRSDASCDLDDVVAKLDGARALVTVNYFGFPQDLAAIRAFCDSRGLLMIEDCAHSFFGSSGGRPLGSFGDYAIASSMKFFPVYEGGCLVSARHSLANVRLRSAGPGFEIKAALAAVERGLGYGRLPAARPMMWLKTALWNALKRRRPADAPALTPDSSDSSYGFDPRWLDKRSALFSRLVVRFAARGRIGQRRRANYLALQAALDGLPGIAPLFAQLPADVYPWAFPVVAADPARVFAPLKRAGVPVTRFAESLWPGVDASVCPASAALSRSVLAFPCHQELTAAERDWMAAAIRSVVEAA